MRTWLLVAAERREFDGLLKRFGSVEEAGLAGGVRGGSRSVGATAGGWWRMGRGREAGRAGVGERVEVRRNRSALDFAARSTRRCGIGDIVDRAAGVACRADRVAVTAAEKSASCARKPGRAAVDMESAAVAEKAARVERAVSFACALFRISLRKTCRSISICIATRAGRFSRTRIALAAVQHDHLRAIPALLRLDRNCRIASEALGEFLCRLPIVAS